MTPPPPEHRVRPDRLTVLDEQGRPQTLAAGPEQFLRLGPERPARGALFLGLGADPAAAAALAEAEGTGGQAAYVEAPLFWEQQGPAWRARLPAAWRRLDGETLTAEDLSGRRVYFHGRVLRLYPSFWGPLWAMCRQWLAGPPALERTNAVLLPSRPGELLREEIADSLERLGCRPVIVAPEEFSARLPALLAAFRPMACLSVNFQGLDPLGESFHLLDRAGAPVAVWCVDNPFHLLSGLRSPYWKRVRLFVTDDWFVEPLRNLGAERVRHLPLGAWRGFAERAAIPGRAAEGLTDRLVFVGRSEFPNRRGYFAGVTPPDGAAQAGGLARAAGERPDFAWQLRRLNAAAEPGRVQRQASLAAEEASREWRTETLRAAQVAGRLTVFGDDPWRALLPGVDLRPMVDYYGPLASIYARAAFCLNATSLLLPRGLTQRHFDVWAAGGFLVTDATPGLDIFPQELTREISFSRPADLAPLLRRLEADEPRRETLRQAWRSLVMTEHAYEKRLETLLADAL